MAVDAATTVFTSAGPVRASDLETSTIASVGPEPTLVSIAAGAVVTLITDRGFELTASLDQQVLVETERKRTTGGRLETKNEWRPFGHLREGDMVVLSNFRRPADEMNTTDFWRGWLVGLVKGNGGHNPLKSGQTYLRFWDADPFQVELSEVADRHVRSLGVGPTYRGGAANARNGTFTIQTTALSNFVTGLLTPKDKNICPLLEYGNPEMVRGFLRGFFDTDGSVQGNQIKGRSVRLNQSDRSALLKVQLMLARFGIITSLYPRKPAGIRPMPDGRGGTALYAINENFELVISKDNIKEFSSRIGFTHRGKAMLLADQLRPSVRKAYVEPFTAKIVSLSELTTADVCNVAGAPSFTANGIQLR